MPTRPDIRTEPPLCGPELGPPGAPFTVVDPDLPGVCRWGYSTYPARVYDTMPVLLPDAYWPRRAATFRAVDFECPVCLAPPGERCFDLRSRRGVRAMHPHYQRREVVLTGPARLVRPCGPTGTLTYALRPGDAGWRAEEDKVDTLW